MKNPKVSIVIPIYRPEKEIFEKLREMLKKQTIKAEIIENWNMPEAESMNAGIKKAKGEIIVITEQDCIPENEFWLEKLIKPMKNKNIAATISDLHLSEEYWKKYSFLTRIFTLPDRKDKKTGADARAGLDARGCAYRKKDLIDIGLFSEDQKMIGIDEEMSIKLGAKGKIVRADTKIFHLHKFKNFREVIKRVYVYSKGNGQFVKRGDRLGVIDFWRRVTKALPLFGILHILERYPFKKHLFLFPVYLVIALPLIHITNIIGFWTGFFSSEPVS